MKQRFDAGEAKQVADSIKRNGEQVDQQMKKLSGEIDKVSAWWEGESGTAFIEEFRSLKPSLDKMVKCVNDISLQLTKVATIKEENERSLAQALRR